MIQNLRHASSVFEEFGSAFPLVPSSKRLPDEQDDPRVEHLGAPRSASYVAVISVGVDCVDITF